MLRGIRKGRLAFTLLSTTSLIAPITVHAQQAGEEYSGEIIVTAQRREESLQKVPLSINVLGSESLENANVASFDDYAKILPSVSFQSFGPSQSQIFFRGVASGGDGLHIGPLPTSSMYIDDVPVTTIGGTVDFHVYDIARIEALAGPQGTLFGASSLSGVLRIITNKPDPTKTSGSIDLQANKWGKGDFGGSVEGYVNLPLRDMMALRVSAFYEKQGGYIDNKPGTRTFYLDDNDPTTSVTVTNAALVEDDFNDVETAGGRAALGIELDDSWTVTPSFMYQHQVAHGSFLWGPVRDVPGNANRPAVSGKPYLTVTSYLPGYNKDEWWQAALTVQGKLSDWDVTYVGGYFERTVDNRPDYSYYSVAYDSYTYEYDGVTYFSDATKFIGPDGQFLDPTQNAILKDKYTKFTQELRVSSPSDKPFRLTAGMFLQIQTDKVFADYDIQGLGTAVDPDWVVPFPNSDTAFRTRINRKDRDYAMFAQAEYDVVPSVTLIGGIRGFMAKNTIFGFSGLNSGSSVDPAICFPTDIPDVPCQSVDKKVDESGVIWKGGVKWQATPDIMFYGTVSRGYRPGGNNRRPGVRPFKADTLDNYEIGWKTRLGPAIFNGAVFYEKWKNLQFGLVPFGQNGVTNTYNAGDARIYGIEGDVSMRFGGLSLSAGATYVDAQLSRGFCYLDATNNPDCSLGESTPSGTRLPVMPKFKGNATARYEAPVGAGTAFFQATVSHQGGTRSFLTDSDFAAVGPTRAFTTADFSIGMRWDHYRVEGFIQNAFSSHGILSLNTVCAPQLCGEYAMAYPTKPQLFGVKVGYDY